MSKAVKRLAIARLWHEGNSFSSVPTTAESFRAVEWHQGDAAVAFHRGNVTEGGAAVAFLDEHPDWQGVFLRCAGASPAGPLPVGLHEAIRGEIVAGLKDGGPWDAVYLSLHGALVAEGVDSPDRELIEAVRAAIGDTPLAVTFDLHANVDPAIAPLVDVSAGYKTHPHVDMDATAARALGLLDRMVAGDIRPICAVAKTGRILPSINMRTAAGPMAEVEAVARDLETRHGLLDATAYGGFTYGDVPYAGASAVVCANGDRTLAQAAAINQRHDDFFMTLPGPAEGIAQALAAPSGLVAVVDGADNPFSGGIADTPAMFRAVVDAAPTVPTVFAFFS